MPSIIAEEVRMSNRTKYVIGFIVFSGLILLAVAYFMQYPILALYYYVLSFFNIYKYSSHVRLSIPILYALFCFSPLILLVWRLPSSRRMRTNSLWVLVNILRRYLVCSLAIFLVVLSLEAGLAFILLSPVERYMNAFVANTHAICCGNALCTIESVVQYVDSRLGWSWNNPMSALEINNMLSSIDYQFLSVFRFTPAHIILWQDWGSCGEHAIVTAYLLNRLGYTARIVRFSDIDHGWAEVYVNGSWYIVDPWYIGIVYENQYQGSRYLVPIEVLASLKNFSGNHRVMCEYLNGTRVDCTGAHGY